MISKILFILLFCLTTHPILGKEIDTSKLKEGDIIFHESKSEQATAIKLATNSRYTHVGIIFKYGDKFKVLEAIEPVKLTDLHSFILRGKNLHYVIKRIHHSNKILTPIVIQQMKDYGNSLLGKHYDLYFEWSNDRIYCTELIWKLYEKFTGLKIGDLKTLKEFDLSSKPVQNLMKKRYGNQIPYFEPVISPIDMFHSKELKTVIEN
ncbi:MAG: YiiX family permuted papain-like enzyme [Leptospira bouyouniensis]|uniref:YiiX family permuted papain-like enzyme n=1 Tax=Leptospira bouyouniensis TaxID=2484911 RepID=A0A7I0IUU3_9LEPT|nr:YiiX family permuted papain-like enzyme [Leptospira bouyouniensis]TGK52815.1 YiiX family permuted papain-like enzyme [Leptospira bouyouniensis]TGL08550.1 YiiX family permuted papain-like enzyme [Leptospira bouyouniensis]